MPNYDVSNKTKAKHWELDFAWQYCVPRNYRSLLPWPVYVELNNKYPRYSGELECYWLRRVASKINTTVAGSAMNTLRSGGFKDELSQAATNMNNRATRGGSKLHTAARVDAIRGGLSRISDRKVHDHRTGWGTNLEGDALRITGANAAAREKAILDEIIALTAVDTPESGSVFWNGVDEMALAKKVDQWNKLPGCNFGQLEATTDVKFINQQFQWNDATGKNTEHYFAGVSGVLGSEARGHMTAVVHYGFRDNSIFTYAELPNILYAMVAAYNKKEWDGVTTLPRVTDISIVVIDDLRVPNPQVSICCNSDILNIPVWQNTRAPKKDIVTLTILQYWKNIMGAYSGKYTVPKSYALEDYLYGRPKIPSPAALKIANEASQCVGQGGSLGSWINAGGNAMGVVEHPQGGRVAARLR